MRRRIGCVTPRSTRETVPGLIPVQAIINGSCTRRAGEVTLKVPKLRQQTFETAIIERYRRREASVEEALIEMYLAGVSVRRVEGITEALWGTKVSPGKISNLNKKVDKKIEKWRCRPIEEDVPYVYLDGIV